MALRRSPPDEPSRNGPTRRRESRRGNGRPDWTDQAIRLVDRPDELHAVPPRWAKRAAMLDPETGKALAEMRPDLVPPDCVGTAADLTHLGQLTERRSTELEIELPGGIVASVRITDAPELDLLRRLGH